jgi:chromosome segregation ATPase
VSKRELASDEAKSLKKKFDAIKPGKTFQFAYIEGGEDDRPLLFVDKKSVSADARAARQTAKKKKMCRGTVALMENKKGYRFTVEAAHPKFAIHLVRYFGKGVPRLKRSMIVVPGEDGQSQQTLGLVDASRGAEAEAKQEAEALRVRIRQLRAELVGQTQTAQTLHGEARRLRSKFFRTCSVANQTLEEAETASEAAASLQRQIDALEAEVQQVAEDGLELTDDEVSDASHEINVQSTKDIDNAGLKVQQLEREAEARESEEAQARLKLARLEEDARELERRMVAKERDAMNAQVRAEVARGKIFSLRSTDRKLQVVADEAKKSAEQMREEQKGFLAELEKARAEVAEASRKRQEARATSSDFLDRYNEAERAWWADRNNSQYVARVVDALEKRSDQLADRMQTAADARSRAGAATTALRTAESERGTAQAALARCKQHKVELQDRIAAIENGKIKVDGNVTQILQDTHQSLSELQNQEPFLQQQLDALSSTVETLQGDLSSARDAVIEAEKESNAARLKRNKHAMFRNEREHIRDLYERQPQLRGDVHQLSDEVANLKKAEDESRAAIQLTIDARKTLQDAHTELNILVLEEQALQKDAAKWTFGKKSRKEEVAAAKQKLIDIRVRKAAASEAYDRANNSLNEALRSADGHDVQKTLTAKKERLAKERELAQKSHALAEVDSQIAQEESRAATITEDLLSKERDAVLEGLRSSDPLLAQASSALKQAQSDADICASSLLEREQRLSVLQEDIEALSTAMETDPSVADQLTKKLGLLSKARRSVQTLRAAADHASDVADEAQKAVDTEVARLCETNPHLSKLENALNGAQLEASIAQSRDVNADQALQRADQATETANRAERSAEVVAEMEGFISASQGLLDEFHQLKKPAQLKNNLIFKDQVIDDDGKNSTTMDLSSPDEVDKLREAIAARAGSEDAEKNQDYVKLLNYQEELEKRAIKMIKAGATVKDLRQAFARVPNGLRPPSYRAEVDAFHTLETAFAEADAEKKQTDREKRILEAAEALTTPAERVERVKQAFLSFGGKVEDLESITSHIPNTMEMAGHQSTEGGGQTATGLMNESSDISNPELVVHLDNIFSSFSALTGVVSTASKFVDYSQDTRETDHLTDEKIELDPIEKKRQQDKLLDATLSAVSATLQTTKQFGAMDVAGNIPILGILGTIDEAKKLSENIVEAAVRRGKARYDRLLADSAKVAGSPLAGAFEESVRQENQLWAKYGLNAAANAATITSHILRAGGPTYAIGVAFQIASTAISMGNAASQDMRNRFKASHAQRLLKAARRGDEAAKTELFKNHAKYAKGLIAHMAYNDKDRFALLYVNKRGIDEDMVAKSSAKILAHYLLEQAEQEEEPETYEEWRNRLKSRMASFGNAINPIQLIRKLINKLASNEPSEIDPAKLANLAELEQDSVEIIDNHRGAAELLIKIDARIQSTEGDAARTALRSKRAALQTLMERYDQFFEKVQDSAVSGLKSLTTDQKTLESLQKSYNNNPDNFTTSALNTMKVAKEWVPKLQKSLINISRNLANAA